MQTTDARKSKSIVLKLNGKLNATAVNALKGKVDSLMEQNKKLLVLDMSQIEFVDSSGLGCLVACFRKASKLGGDIKLAKVQDSVKSLFELTRLHRLFEIHDDVMSAQNSF
jgi:anti-sigma B factor antagonist